MTTPRGILGLIHATLSSTARTLRAIALIGTVRVLGGSWSSTTAHAVARLLHLT